MWMAGMGKRREMMRLIVMQSEGGEMPLLFAFALTFCLVCFLLLLAPLLAEFFEF